MPWMIDIPPMFGPAFAAAMKARKQTKQITPSSPTAEPLVLSLVLGTLLDESIFRACILPVLAQTAGTIIAVIITAVMFRLLLRA